MPLFRFANTVKSPTTDQTGWQIESEDVWPAPTTDEGQLPIDVYRHGSDLVIRSTIAGVDPEDLEVAINGDLLTIRGKRELAHEIKEDDWFHQECYWGAFSRSLILPMDVEAGAAQASLKHGVLEIRIPLVTSGYRVPITPKP